MRGKTSESRIERTREEKERAKKSLIADRDTARDTERLHATSPMNSPKAVGVLPRHYLWEGSVPDAGLIWP